MAAKQQEYLALIPQVTRGCILKQVKQEKTEPGEMSQGHIKTASSRSSSSFYNARLRTGLLFVNTNNKLQLTCPSALHSV